jgi:hypothetical protein
MRATNQLTARGWPRATAVHGDSSSSSKPSMRASADQSDRSSSSLIPEEAVIVAEVPERGLLAN